MIGYGDEDNNFVAELTYNYGVRTYEPGNMHIATLIKSSSLSPGTMKSPCGYRFDIMKAESGTSGQPTSGVRLASSDLKRTENFWTQLAKLNLLEKTESKLAFNYPSNNDGIWNLKKSKILIQEEIMVELRFHGRRINLTKSKVLSSVLVRMIIRS